MYEKEKTALVSSVDADDGQSIQNNYNISIAKSKEKVKQIGGECYEFSKKIATFSTMTMEELYEKTFEVNVPIIEGVLYAGTYLLAGPAKVGKSFLMAQIAYHVSTGLPLWGNSVRVGTVLYLALEDDYSRLQRRLFRMFGEESTSKLYLATHSKILGNGLEEQLQEFLQAHGDTRLIIIDVLQRVRSSDCKEYSYANDYEVVTKLKKLTEGEDIALLIVYHTRKQQAEDIFSMISGANGLLGGADGAFILSKEKRTGKGGVLDVVGRDQPDQKFYLSRNAQTLAWELERLENRCEEEPPDPLLEQVAEFLYVCGQDWQGTPTQLKEALNLEIQPNILTLKLNLGAERLRKDYGIFFQSSRNHEGRKVALSFVEQYVK